ncbi:proline-rich transmembrane protein 4 [Salvelinus fontinalis]|uniref:proline-rich transmembrane protein 4 n=1 Tax=Salvelinus fontinalis TaxID=8038 RepID=UPI002485E303|nr:proline-rich transmembrane protein 4 [Salvelinus fontinalis]XP_055793319.1 proline-rich transmembrane protein 4 [Salvelinus fontinalis]
MHHLRRMMSLCLWCSLLAILLHTTVFADEEADVMKPTGPPASKEWPYWPGWSLPKQPSLSMFPSLPAAPSFPFSSLNPFGGKSQTKNAGPQKTTPSEGPTKELSKGLIEIPTERPTEGPTEGPTEPENSPGHSGSSTITSWTESHPSSTEIRTVTNPQTVTPNKSTQPNTQDILDSITAVLDSISSISVSQGVDIFSDSLTSTNILPQTIHAYLSPETAQTPKHSWSVTTKSFPKETKIQDELVPQSDPLTASVPHLTFPQTTVPTTLVTTPPRITVNTTQVETTLTSQPFDSGTQPTSPQTRVTTRRLASTVSTDIGTKEAPVTKTQPSQSSPDLGFSEAKAGPVEEQLGANTTTRTEDRTLRVNSPTPGGNLPDPEDWLFDPTGSEATYLPDCNQERSGICNISDTWVPPTTSDVLPTANTPSTNQSNNPFLILARPMFISLHSDWNSAMAAWGLAWDAHVYGLGSIFAMVTLASALNLLCLPLRCPSGCGYFALVSVFLLAAGCTRAFSLLYDAYGHQDRLPSTEASLLLYEAPFPCLTAAFGLVFLLLSMRSRMQLSYSAFQRPCFLACLVLLHFAAAFGPVALLRLYQRRAPFSLFISLISRGAFVALVSFLSVAYFVFFCYVRADSKHIYHLNNTSPTPAERYNRCPFAESRDWDRAAATVCLSALFCLACAGLQLYAMLHSLGLAGGADVFRPWPWWTFQLSCRVCEAGVCLTLALVVAQPIYCSDHLPQPGSCWTELLAIKSPIMPGTYQWTLSQQEKLAICDIGHGETECLPLYTLVDERLGSSLNGLDLLYHSNRALAYRDLDLNLDLPGSSKPDDRGGGAASGGSSFTSDSTADLRPPSPINLRRSIDEALFSEDLFPISLFFDLSLNIPYSTSTLPNGGQVLRETLSADPGLYRTTSCVEMVPPPPTPLPNRPMAGDTILGAPPSPSLSSNSSCSSPERWRGSSSSCSLYRPSLRGSSLVLCSSPEGHAQPPSLGGSSSHITASSHQGSHMQRHYRTLGSASQESLDLESEVDRSVQEEFINVCRQIDAMSICSETIDL